MAKAIFQGNEWSLDVSDGFSSPGREPDAGSGFSSEDMRQQMPTKLRWRDVPLDDTGTSDRIDPLVLTIVLDDLLSAERVVKVDSGIFMGYPSMFLSVPNEHGFCFTQAFQSRSPAPVVVARGGVPGHWDATWQPTWSLSAQVGAPARP